MTIHIILPTLLITHVMVNEMGILISLSQKHTYTHRHTPSLVIYKITLSYLLFMSLLSCHCLLINDWSLMILLCHTCNKVKTTLNC